MARAREFTSRVVTVIRRSWIHGVLWVAFYLLVALVARSGERAEGWAPGWSVAAVAVLLALPPVYVHGIALEQYFFTGRYGRYAALVVAAVLGWAFLVSAILPRGLALEAGFSENLLTIVIVLIPVSLVWMLRNASRTQSLLQEARAKQAEAELSLLKAQIHPHFLFNTLNNLFALARRGDPAAGDGIATLSRLLRYMIDERDVAAVPLSLELEQIERLIGLAKLRFDPNDEVAIEVRIDGNPDAGTVPPMLLVPLVENALKHGVSLTAPSFVRAALRIESDRLRFTVENSTPARSTGAPGGTGLGLQHLKRRLELLYPDAHDLRIESDGPVFRVDLHLNGVPTGGGA